ncbi:DUF4238 domain-containing protein [Chryseobacterium sp. Leaf394]|uniref:DUF4238 domain-containing protein n=1 Tax=Chryseobacterium sp. Leaf394 TaxID=1736361 RepID=UPI000700A421|nr:DUF4238 domain-containing protein [Chryseobacterium sp. Leaf394]KQS89214.1 hypothetical protein ASG21_15625 [Chryseobacterium sp. Leaf394]
MSIPKNHHYISQVHIKNFFNNEKKEIYLYDKQKENHFAKKTTKSIFSEKNLNTKLKNKDYDYSSVEQQLNDHFERDFASSFEIVSQFINDKIRTVEFDNAIIYFAKYAVISELRTPFRKRNTDEAIYKGLSIIKDMGDDKLKKNFEDYFSFNDERKYSNAVNYIDFSQKVLKSMGEIFFVIETPQNENDFYFLPDFGAATTRAKINSYFNPDVKEIAYIGIPISSKIYIHFYSSKLNKKINHSRLAIVDSEIVFRLNKMNFDYSNQIIACESKGYIEEFIKTISKY